MDALSTSTVALRPVEVADMDALFEQMRDPVGWHIAGRALAQFLEIEETILRLSRRRGHGRRRPQPDPRDVPPTPRSG